MQKGMAPIVQSNNRNLRVDWKQDIKRQEKGRMFEERNSGLYYKFAGGSVENLSEAKNDSEERQAKIRWIAFKNQFFSSVPISKRPFNTADFDSKVLKGSDYLKSLETTAVVNDYDWSAENPVSFDYFIGPNLYPLLSSIDKKAETDEDLSLTRLIPLGWSLFRWINTGVIIPIFNLLGSWISNYGIIILILTLIIKLVLFPPHIQEHEGTGQDAHSRARHQGPKRQVPRTGKRDAPPAEDHGPLQQGRSEPDVGMPADAASDADTIRHVHLLPLLHRTARAELPLGA